MFVRRGGSILCAGISCIFSHTRRISYLAHAGIVLAMKVEKSDDEEVGLEEVVERESLSHLRRKDVFIRSGGD